jgi:hypothetical protein
VERLADRMRGHRDKCCMPQLRAAGTVQVARLVP